ncbi:MAG TPA: SufD family Fe-S cluster assembly protein [Candidatus Sulfotelmatobacter sp.]|jgi:Fe-S cluster assembly protein SufD|nr:SufD family Fe-S cluster assembly protein [Candidatus Sulfotelmatobacter sp.]
MEAIVVKENEELVLPVLWIGDETELIYNITLAGKGASVKFLGLLIGNNNQGLKLKITVVHQAENTKSEVIIKSALYETAHVFIDGLIKIESGAKGTNAWLAAHLLLLSDKAKGIAIPNLEILENDIKAGHAATVGRINELELFYLMSRGISEEKAKNLIVDGFFESIITQFPQEFQEKARANI